MPTQRRIYRINKVMHSRQLDLAIALDRVHDQHNLSAVLRTADATGIGNVVWFPDLKKPESVNPEVSKGSEKWVKLEIVNNLKEKLVEMKARGYRVAATHMAHKAVDFRTIDWTKPWVVVMGNEQRGCSDEILEVADENIFLPMHGFVQSLNISVAAAVIMYEIQRQRDNAGMYNVQADAKKIQELFQAWKLADQDYCIEDFYQKHSGKMPECEIPHADGRSVPKFSKKNSKKI
ncbi:MAG: tRNA (guanosine(18)-2'-O)-methyltransferase TrmH [Candidatus Rifleibacteriota bacterium]